MLSIPDLSQLVATVHRHRLHESTLHGEQHWQCVAWTGLHLLPDVPGSDPAVVFLFALFHDSQRLNDATDPGHGRRGGELARRLHGQVYHCTPGQLDLLYTACCEHTDGRVSADPTIGVCWDADRLNLWRVGMRPNARWLSTLAAQQPSWITWARTLQTQPFTWEALYAEFQLRCGEEGLCLP